MGCDKDYLKKNTRTILSALLSTTMIVSCSNISTDNPPSHTIAESAEKKLQKGNIIQIANSIANWQILDISSREHDENLGDDDPKGWVYAPLHIGLITWGQETKQDKYIEFALNAGQDNKWELGPRLHNADDYAIATSYLKLSEIYDDNSFKQIAKARLDAILSSPSNASLNFVRDEDSRQIIEGREYFDIVKCKERWCWCDALFMGPPVWAALARLENDHKYLEHMEKEFWQATDYLFDSEEDLFFRDDRFFERRDRNGKKIFWSRGNGWVLAGLALTLEQLPDNYPTRQKYEDLFKKMSSKLIKIQSEDGYWRTSLLAPELYPKPESSGTAFYVYGLAWGVNNGLLDIETYQKPIHKGWSALEAATSTEGKLGWVQQIGNAPGSATAEDTQVYGVGAMLLAASEMVRLLD